MIYTTYSISGWFVCSQTAGFAVVMCVVDV